MNNENVGLVIALVVVGLALLLGAIQAKKDLQPSKLIVPKHEVI